MIRGTIGRCRLWGCNGSFVAFSVAFRYMVLFEQQKCMKGKASSGGSQAARVLIVLESVMRYDLQTLSTMLQHHRF